MYHVSQPRFCSEREVALGHCTVVGGCHVRSPGPFSRSYTLFVSISLARCDDCDAFPGNTLSLLRSLSLSLSCHSVTRSLWLSLSHSPSTGPLVLPGRATRCNTARESDGSIRTPHFSGELGVVFPFPSFNERDVLTQSSLTQTLCPPGAVYIFSFDSITLPTLTPSTPSSQPLFPSKPPLRSLMEWACVFGDGSTVTIACSRRVVAEDKVLVVCSP